MNGSVTINGVKYPVTINDLTPADVLPIFRTDTSILKTDSLLLHAAGTEQNSAKKVLLLHLVSMVSASVAEDLVLTIEPYYDENGEYQGMYWHYNGQWLRRTDTGEMIRVDDTAAEIALAADIASRAAQNANTAADGAIAADHLATDNENARVTAENVRLGNEKSRQQQEKARETQATEDHETAESDHRRAENMHQHPPYVADGTDDYPGDIGYLYTWDYEQQQYVRRSKLSLDWASMSQAQQDELATEVLATLTFASVETCESIIDELT